jgi:NAD(P)H-dependent FMN reductase
VLLAVPEYALGIPGAFKNALDWTVGSASLYRKPVQRDIGPDGEIGDPTILDQLQAVVAGLVSRAH